MSAVPPLCLENEVCPHVLMSMKPSSPSPLYAAQSLTQDGQVLGQLHHGDDDGSSNQGAGWPEQGVEDHDLAVDLFQDGTVCPARRVHETLNGVLRPEVLRNVLNNCMCGCIVLLALGDEEALKENQDKKKNRNDIYVPGIILVQR